MDCGFKGHERNASIFIGFPLQMARKQFEGNLTWVRIPPAAPKIRPSAFGRWSYFWCGHGDSNPNAVKHENLNLACLPISSCPHSNAILPQPRAGSKQKIAVRFLKAAETRKRCIFYFVLRLHNERETHGANPVSPAFLIRFRRAAAPPSGAAFFRRTSASRCRTRRGWSGAASE